MNTCNESGDQRKRYYEIFNDHVLATAILDRLLHYATTLNIKGESYRLKERRKAGLLGQPKPVVMEAEQEEIMQI